MAKYQTQTALGYAPNQTVVPALVNAPIIFIAPPEKTVSSGELWLVVSNSDPNYGGCFVWASNDDAHYRRIGKIVGNATQGVLTANLASATGLDTTNTLSLNLAQSKEIIESTDQQSVDTYDSLCYVGGELLAYKTATLTGANTYNLTYLRRGLYGTTPGATTGDDFALLDETVFKKRFNSNKVGKTVWFKFQAFNSTEKGRQDLADLTAYSFLITHDGGTKALLTDLTSPFRGLYATLTDLQTALPTANAGDYAQVDAGIGAAVTTYYYDVTGADWIKASGDFAPLVSPALTGIPTAPTADPGTNTTQISTTAFVQEAISTIGVALAAERLTPMVFKGGNQDVVYINGTDIVPSFVTTPDCDLYVTRG